MILKIQGENLVALADEAWAKFDTDANGALDMIEVRHAMLAVEHACLKGHKDLNPAHDVPVKGGCCIVQ
jgi:hypothetical protein